MFDMDLIAFDVEKNKMAPEFKMAAKNCFWSRVHIHAFIFKILFILGFLSVLRSLNDDLNGVVVSTADC
jgi:hypothetical protein